MLYVVVAVVLTGLVARLLPSYPWIATLYLLAGGLLLARTLLSALSGPRPVRSVFTLGATVLLAAATVLALSAFRIAAAPGQPGELRLVADPRGDCVGCPPNHELVGLGVRAADEGAEIAVQLAAPPAPGDVLWLWLQAHPAHPLLFERLDDGWGATVPGSAPFATDDLQVGVYDDLVVIGVPSDPGGVAVVSGGGDRAPDLGYVDQRGQSEPQAEGRLAHDLHTAVAAVQAGFPHLSNVQRELARAVLARQLVTGTYHFDLVLEQHPTLRLNAEVAVRFPELAQHLRVERDGEWLLAQSLYVLADGITVCTLMTDGSAACEPVDGLALPVTGLLGLVEDPAGTTVEAAPPRAWGEETVRCWRVVASSPDGPPEGESCAAADGFLAVNDNQRTGQRLVLTSRDAAVDPDVFELPEEG